MTEHAADAAARPRGHARWRRAADVVLLVGLVGLLVVAGLRRLDSTSYAVVVLQTAGPVVVVGLVLLAVLTLLLRRWVVAVPVVVAALVGVGLSVPAWSSSTRPKDDVDLTVLSVNLHEGRANPRQVMDAVRYHAVDVLVLVEVTPQAVADLDDEGARTFFPRRVGQAREGVSGTLVLSRFPLTTLDAVGSTDGAGLQPVVDVKTPAGAVRVRAVHPSPPLADRTAAWHASLTDLGSWAKAQPAGERFVLAGDFNASSGHPVFRRLAEGLVDAQDAAGRGWVRTWPFEGRRVPPYVALDHQLSRGLVVVDAGQVALNRSDHAAVWASYAVPAAR